MSLIQKVGIRGLNGNSDVEISLRGRHCIIVGPNGSGKSTFLSILACALGREWRRLATLRFESLEITFNNRKVATIDRTACEEYSRAVGSIPNVMTLRRPLYNQGDFLRLMTDENTSSVVTSLAAQLRLPQSELKTIHRYLSASLGDSEIVKRLDNFSSILEDQKQPSILYLPTYRRIELELQRLFEGNADLKRAIPSLTTGMSSEFVTEVIRFGMEDITATIRQFERETRDLARNRFNRMMTSYLKEMTNSAALSVADLRSRNISQDIIDTVLSRIEEGLLNDQEKQQIADTILSLTSSRSAGNPPFTQKWLAHFFVRLLEVHNDLVEREQPMLRLVSTLKKYFQPTKELFYDTERYHFGVRSLRDQSEIELGDLSSGEKQVVSILSHLNFSPADKVNVLIDEPELSLFLSHGRVIFSLT
jgi:energy-coupling factor transporter ATP-binding protein EcfA2